MVSNWRMLESLVPSTAAAPKELPPLRKKPEESEEVEIVRTPETLLRPLPRSEVK